MRLIISQFAGAEKRQGEDAATAAAALDLAREMMKAKRDVASADQSLMWEEVMKDWETKIFPIKHAHLGSLGNLLSAFRAIVRQDNRLNALAVRAPKEIMPAITETIARFDVPQASEAHDVQLVGYILSTKKLRDLPMPPDLQKNIEQFKTILAFSDYSLLESFILRTSHNGTPEVSGYIPLGGEDVSSLRYEVRANLGVAPAESGAVIRLNNLRLFVRVPFNTGCSRGSFEDGNIQTSISIPAGKTVVVGKSTFRDQALLLVLRAELLK